MHYSRACSHPMQTASPQAVPSPHRPAVHPETEAGSPLTRFQSVSSGTRSIFYNFYDVLWPFSSYRCRYFIWIMPGESYVQKHSRLKKSTRLPALIAGEEDGCKGGCFSFIRLIRHYNPWLPFLSLGLSDLALYFKIFGGKDLIDVEDHDQFLTPLTHAL